MQALKSVHRCSKIGKHIADLGTARAKIVQSETSGVESELEKILAAFVICMFLNLLLLIRWCDINFNRLSLIFPNTAASRIRRSRKINFEQPRMNKEFRMNKKKKNKKKTKKNNCWRENKKD